MKKKIFHILLLVAALSTSFFIGAIVNIANSYLGLAMTIGGTIILVIGYILGTKKKNDVDDE